MSKLLSAALNAEQPLDKEEASVESILIDEARSAHDLLVVEQSIESIETHLDILGDASDNMMELSSSMEADIAANDVSLETARVYSIAYKAIVGNDDVVISMESIVDSETAVDGLQVSMEKMGDTIKKIWEAIKRTIVRAMTAIADFFAKLFGSTGKLRARNESIRKRLTALKDEKAKKDTIEVAGAHQLHLDGKLTPEVIKSGTSSVIKNVGETIGELTKFTYEINMAMVHLADLPIKQTDKFVEAHEETLKTADAKVSKLLGTKADQAAKLPGDMMFMAHAKSIGKSIALPKITSHPKAVAYSGKGSIDTPTPTFAIDLCNDVDKIIDIMEKREGEVKKMNEGRKKAVAEADKWIKEADKGVVEGWLSKTTVNLFTGALTSTSTTGVQSAYSYMFAYARKLMGLSEAVAAAYE